MITETTGSPFAMMNVKTWMKAILAEPDDDSHRLVFADWLDDQGHSDRAEFIRVQCALARRAGDDPQRPERTRRQEALLDLHEKEWQKEVAAWAGKYARFRRGFVDRSSTGFKTFIVKGGAWLGKAPVTSVYLLDANGANLKALAACPHLASLRDIQFRDCEIENIGLLLGSPYAAGLRGLHFYVLAGF